jgi:hypothetical protein
MMNTRTRFWLSGAGFFAGPAAWALHQQIGYMLVPVSCQARTMLVPIVTLLAVVLALAGSYLSWMPWRAAEAGESAADAIRARRFLAILSAWSAALFAFAILLQGAATLILNGCQR